ncbi:MAG TPA: hypothetical protein VNH84_06435 [Candidatus Saccharimonadales bacterium]|nr:hypothetical protein [Candidatus Saccharimonadales bacterium]
MRRPNYHDPPKLTSFVFSPRIYSPAARGFSEARAKTRDALKFGGGNWDFARAAPVVVGWRRV